MKRIAAAIFILMMIAPAVSGAAGPSGYDASLFIEATTLIQAVTDKKPVFLVDIRHARDYGTYKIPGSIHIPLDLIKTKSFLKTNPVVLIHQACDYSRMLSCIHELQNKGFNIKILFGGLSAWHHKKGTLVGDPFAPFEANLLPVSTVIQEQNQPEWVMIETGKTVQPAADRVAQIFKQSKNPLTSVLILTPTGETIEKTDQTIASGYKDRVFYLKGGIEARDKFLTFQKLAQSPKQKRLQTTGHCQPCEEQKNQKRKP